MLNIPTKIQPPLTRQTLFSLNEQKKQKSLTKTNILELNRTPISNATSHHPSSDAKLSMQTVYTEHSVHTIPPLLHPVQKGQKVSLETGSMINKIKVKLGWCSTHSECDVDVSAFLLDASGKVTGDDWFVFYGQPQSPDGSTIFSDQRDEDLEHISIDLARVHPSVSKIVFVLTINDAFQKHLHFGMIKDAYIRILDAASNNELVSFQMTDYYTNVISMMIGELYRYKGSWKFSAIGNGVAKDLAGLCEFYGVQVVS